MFFYAFITKKLLNERSEIKWDITTSYDFSGVIGTIQKNDGITPYQLLFESGEAVGFKGMDDIVIIHCIECNSEEVEFEGELCLACAMNQ